MQALALLGRRALLQRACAEGWPALSQYTSAMLPEDQCSASHAASTSAPALPPYGFSSMTTRYCSPFNTTTRGFAGPAGDDVTGSRLDFNAKTMGFVRDSYRIKPRLSPTFFMSKEGRKDASHRIKEFLVLRMAILNKARQCVPGFSKGDFILTVIETYKKFNEALATGDLLTVSNMPDILGDSEMRCLQSDVERRLRRRQTIEWSLAEDLSMRSISIVQGRLDKLNPKQQSFFMQLTVRIASKQRFAVYNHKGELVAGDPEQVIDVVDFWVMERKILEPVERRMVDPVGARWRLVGRIAAEQSPDAQQGKVEQQQQAELQQVALIQQQQQQQGDQQAAAAQQAAQEQQDKQQRQKQRRKQQDKQAAAWSSAFRPGA